LGKSAKANSKTLSNYAWLSLIRAFGVVLVLIYHLNSSWLPGGFIGVDVFFVFSGYLITSLFIKEYNSTGTVKLKAFVVRRFRRLFPALLCMLLVILPLALLISPDFRVGSASQSLAALAWVTNYFEIFTGQSYANNLLPHLFVHTWTLSIEMQYYLVWGIVVFFIVRSFTKKTPDGKSNAKSIIPVLLIISLAVIIVSYVLMQVYLVGQEDPTRAYFDTTSHLFPLFIGSLLGLLAGFESTKLVKRLEKIGKFPALFLTIFAVLGIIALALTLPFENLLVYRFGILATSLLSGLIILMGRGKQKQLQNHREQPILKYLADRSYSLYLFHWPVFVIIGNLNRTAPFSLFSSEVTWALLALLSLALTFALSHLCYRFVEVPFRRKGALDLQFAKKRILPYGAAALCLFAVSAVSLATAPKITSIEESFQKGLQAQKEQSVREIFGPFINPDQKNASGSGAQLEYVPAEGVVPGTSFHHGAVTIIGDSVTLGAVVELQEATGAQVDAAVSRSMYAGEDMIANLDAANELSEYVVVALATNTHVDSFDAAERIVQNISPGHRLIFVTAYGGGGNPEFNFALRELAGNHPFITIADWEPIADQNIETLAADNIHLSTQEACDFYTQTIVTALLKASLKETS